MSENKNWKGMAEEVRSRGRYGDEYLLHVNGPELEYLVQATGIPLTINPDTGQPEAFLQFLLPLLGSVAGEALLASSGMAALGGAVGSGLGTLAAGGDIEDALLSFGTSGLMGALGGSGITDEIGGLFSNPAQAAASTAAQVPANAGNAVAAAASNSTQALNPAIATAPPTNLVPPGGSPLNAAPRAPTALGAPGGLAGLMPENAAMRSTPSFGDRFTGLLMDRVTDPMTLVSMALMPPPGRRGGGGDEEDEDIPENFPANPRSFIPTPPGYRPGIDPEHRYFAQGGMVNPGNYVAGHYVGDAGEAGNPFPETQMNWQTLSNFVGNLTGMNGVQGKAGFWNGNPAGGPTNPGPSRPPTPRPAPTVNPVDLSAFIPNLDLTRAGYTPPQTPDWASRVGTSYGSAAAAAAPPMAGTGLGTGGSPPPVAGNTPVPAGPGREGRTRTWAPLLDKVHKTMDRIGINPGINTIHDIAGRFGVDMSSPEATLKSIHSGIKGRLGFAGGGPVAAPEEIVQAAIAALKGQHPDPESAIMAFIEAFGEEALADLQDQVLGGINGMTSGPGGGMDDMIPAMIDGGQPAALSSGEFVVPADAVSHMGDGSSEAGAARLQEMIDQVRMQKTGKKAQPGKVNLSKVAP